MFCFIVLFIILHLRPLTKDEIGLLAEKQRKTKISLYFKFDNREYLPNKDFKKRMDPSGNYYKINDSLFEIPAIASSLLKYKKHEWIIITFEKYKNINMIWLNKGSDKSSVSLTYDFSHFVKYANRNNYSSILIFHNHPNSRPNEFNKTSPSEKDISSAKEFAEISNSNGINLLEFVCERGRHYQYYHSYYSGFLPKEEFIHKINLLNNVSKYNNLKLHLQRYY